MSTTQKKELLKKTLAKPPLLWYYSFVVARQRADIAQSVERILGKDEVSSSILLSSTGYKKRNFTVRLKFLFYYLLSVPWTTG